MALCGARTADGTSCRNRVAKSGRRCHLHGGGGSTRRITTRQPYRSHMRTRPSASAISGPSMAQRNPQHGSLHEPNKVGHVTPSRVDEAASLCQELLADGWQETVAGRAADYLAGPTWRELTRGTRSRNCRALARLARRILQGKQRLHDVVGSIARKSVTLLGGRRFARRLAAELAAKLPLPFDDQAIAVARGIQISGVLLCLGNGRNLSRCACFVDLAREEGKVQVKQVMVAALDDWRGLARLPPAADLGP
jgi:hypothetical protein